MFYAFKNAAVMVAVSVVISACGGGGSGGTPPPEPPKPVLTERYLETVFTGEFFTKVTANVAYTPKGNVGYQDLEQPLTDRIVIKYKNTSLFETQVTRKLAITQTSKSVGVELYHVREMSDSSQIFKLDSAKPLEEVRAYGQLLMRLNPNIVAAEPDIIVRPTFVPNDTFITSQWSLSHENSGVDAVRAWELSRGHGVVVAVIDTGLVPHSDLDANVLPGYDLITSATVAGDGDARDPNAADPGDFTEPGQCGSGRLGNNSTWHGTHVAGIVAAIGNNSKGVSGVAPQAKVLPVRVLGKCGGYLSDAADAISWASGGALPNVPPPSAIAKVLNLSLSGNSPCPSYMQSAVDAAVSRNATVVAAAGNFNKDVSTATPANCLRVVAVGSVDYMGAKSDFSNHGPQVTVSAPGGGGVNAVLSTHNNGLTVAAQESYRGMNGTSMAAPHVAGTVALMLSLKPDLTVAQIIDLLKSTAKPLGTVCELGCGAGMVNANSALLAVKQMLPPPPQTGSYAEVEPNDTIATAMSLTATSSTVTANVLSQVDLDYYNVQVPIGKKMTVTVTPSDVASGFGILVSTESGKTIAELPGTVAIKPSIGVLNQSGGYVNVLIKVHRQSGNIGNYTLTTTVQ